MRGEKEERRELIPLKLSFDLRKCNMTHVSHTLNKQVLSKEESIFLNFHIS